MTAAPKKKQSEKTVEAYLRDQVKALGGKAYKFVSPGTVGVPDRLIVLPYGLVYFRELKREGFSPSDVTPGQRAQLEQLTALGCNVGIVGSKAQADEFIAGCRDALARAKFKREALGHE